jgi:amino acid adenylation domain-containing protein
VITAIFEANGAYLPLDSRAPVERLRFMLADAGVSVLIVDRHSAGVTQSLNTSAQVIVFEDVFECRPQPILEPRNPVAASPEQLAYVIYTSGSTGEPKGIEILVHSLLHFLGCMQRELAFGQVDTLLAIAPLSFDVAVFELLMPLYSGGRVVLLPSGSGADGESVSAAIRAYDPSVLLATPTTWQLLLDAGWSGSPKLHAVCGGEILHASLASRLAPLTNQLWNHYGPTETTIAASTYLVLGDEASVPIGKPIDGIRLYVIDAAGNSATVGEPGELYIAGSQLARGYRNRAELTGQRFVHIAVGDAQVRAYRTGDLVRFDDRGNLEFLGRVDNQVKIRGYRMELEEIEVALSRHPRVKQAAVVVRECGEDDVRLVAFVTPQDGIAPDAANLLDFLATVLPAYMIPRRIVFINQLPQSATGKVDRRALRKWHVEEPEVHPIPEPAKENNIESELLDIWQRLPGFESASVNDNFFESGGHSLLAAKLMREVRARFGSSPPISVLFQAPTVRELAERIVNSRASPDWSPIVTMRGRGSRAPLFCVHGIGGNVLNFEPLLRYLTREQPIFGLEARGLNGGVPHRTIGDMAHCYVEAMRTVQSSGPYFLAGYSAGGVVAYEMACQLHAAGQDVLFLGLLDAALHPRAVAQAGAPRGNPGGRLRKVNRLVRRFMAMKPSDRRESLVRNCKYCAQLLATSARALGEDLAKLCGVSLQGPNSVKEAFLLALRHYRPNTFNGRAVLYRATNGVGRDDEDPTMGWGAIAPAVRVEVFDAGHPGILTEPAVIGVAHSMDRHICEALPRTGMAGRARLVPI